ncbi:ribosomal subunit interface protein [Candidatus Curtissbacteria bacterium RIFCSPHIGHO2_01_FULL_41_11]|uniref:Ribosomal subunit interface protein n=1 Tax=Candidatus Curtissbacteria bacterium RIFCSPHIGHO2_01_FULL_41_11 TaxID=1797711 RepID=A0A1F5G557_9BACT|nr:MAG: ribosomal subunit interface protein [Candidatus Curtissbacteria bacterium RIFCSPHIGHO2_01_FULL_41_11]
MQIIVSGSRLVEFPEIEAYAREKVSKLSKYSSKIENIRVRLISEKSHRNEQHNSFCEIALDLPGKNLEVKDSENSMDKAIDKAVERMKRALVKYKEKSVSKKHKEGTFARKKT